MTEFIQRVWCLGPRWSQELSAGIVEAELQGPPEEVFGLLIRGLGFLSCLWFLLVMSWVEQDCVPVALL